MEIKLRLGGVLFLFCMESDLTVNPELANFAEQTEEKEEIRITVSKKWEEVTLPRTGMSGEDALLKYYSEGNIKFCLAKGGSKGELACTCYTPDFRKVLCTLNDTPFLFPVRKLGSVLRMLPMREIFLHFHSLFLHASQISYNKRGILFTGPSGAGKSTQAKLWKKYRKAEIVCNDRTILRRKDGVWHTYGYPLDGSEPVCSNAVNRLGCIVVLEQETRNKVRKLQPGKAVSHLMGQTVMDCWSGAAREQAMHLIIELLRDIPVYLLGCTPDEQAVNALEAELVEEGVIVHGESLGSALEKGGDNAFAADGSL